MHAIVLKRWLAVVVAWLGPTLAAPCLAAESVARLTLLDGQAALIRGAEVAAAPLGLALQAGDIVESSKGAALVRIEFNDRRVLDLGPDTRVLLLPPPAPGRSRRPAQAYVLSGWTKLSSSSGEASVISNLAEASTAGSVLLQVAPRRTSVFAETGPAGVLPQGSASSLAALNLGPGQFATLSADRASQEGPLPPPAVWLAGVPRALRESPSPRLERFANVTIVPDAPRDVTAADVEPWLNAEPRLRAELRSRWALVLRDNEARTPAGRSPAALPMPTPPPPLAARAVESAAIAKPPAAPPSPAPEVAREATTAAPSADKPADRVLAVAFSDIARTVQGGAINAITFAEFPGDAVHSQLSVRDGDLWVSGRFAADAQSAYAGVGVSLNMAKAPFDATAYKTLRIRLSATHTNTLRVRLLGSDRRVLQSGCYPVATQSASAQPRDYDIPIGRFVPEGFCGNRGVSANAVLAEMSGIEVTDIIGNGGARPVQFGVGNIVLLR
jgi:hypothetical protein